ncbi:MAG: hypothetical protein JWR05_2806 [Mucilaginibacter sp.]|nr:hypothetical protein [Mucilaginibacter sp.]
MDIIFIRNQIKYDILNILGLPAEQCYNLLGTTLLYLIGYGENMIYAENLKANCKVLQTNIKPANLY